MTKQKQPTKMYFVGAVGDWWIERPPSFPNLDRAIKFYLDGRAIELYCGKPCFIAEDVKFRYSINGEGNIVLAPNERSDTSHYLTIMYEADDRGFISKAHKTTKYKTLKKLLDANKDIVGFPNILILRGLELEITEERK